MQTHFFHLPNFKEKTTNSVFQKKKIQRKSSNLSHGYDVIAALPLIAVSDRSMTGGFYI